MPFAAASSGETSKVVITVSTAVAHLEQRIVSTVGGLGEARLTVEEDPEDVDDGEDIVDS